jgi:transcriptional regulator with XRE-family HTH domain
MKNHDNTETYIEFDKLSKRKIFSERFNSALHKKNLSQSDIAKMLNVDRQLVSKYANGISIPRGTNLVKIAEILSVRDTWLMGINERDSDVIEKLIDKKNITEIIDYTFQSTEAKMIEKFKFIESSYIHLVKNILINLFTLNYSGLVKVQAYLNDIKGNPRFRPIDMIDFRKPLTKEQNEEKKNSPE